MRELDTCLDIIKEIKEKDETIQELRYRTMSPKSQVITDMPKGGGAHVNALDNYMVKLERTIKAKERLQEKLDYEWAIAKFSLTHYGITKSDTIELLRLRFYRGLPWKKCSMEMQKTYPDSGWNINKCFRVYRAVLHKTNSTNSSK